jgi:hypothetical protein
MVIAGAIILLLFGGHDVRPPSLLWDIPRIAQYYTTIQGFLAGFSVTSAIFLANLSVVRDSPEFEGVMGLFLLAFLAFIASAMAFATIPNAVDDSSPSFGTIQRLTYMLSLLGYFSGIGLSWLALRLLLLAIGLTYLADIFVWVLLVVLFAGSSRVCFFLNSALMVNRRGASLVPVIGFSIAIIYGIVVAPLFSDLWPGRNAPLMFGLVCFVCGTLCFATHAVILGYASELPEALLKRLAPRAAMLHSQLVITAVGFLWVAVAKA